MAVLLAVVATAACLVPAARATRIDPVTEAPARVLPRAVVHRKRYRAGIAVSPTSGRRANSGRFAR